MAPNWQPEWEDVRFDHGAAATAADACDALADGHFGMWGGVRGLVPDTRTDWVGATRTGFDDGVDRIQDEQYRTMSDLRDLADDLRAASLDAAAEQLRREDERERWRQQLAAELRVGAS